MFQKIKFKPCHKKVLSNMHSKFNREATYFQLSNWFFLLNMSSFDYQASEIYITLDLRALLFLPLTSSCPLFQYQPDHHCSASKTPPVAIHLYPTSSPTISCTCLFLFSIGHHTKEQTWISYLYPDLELLTQPNANW